jgi:hypothetical protein
MGKWSVGIMQIPLNPPLTKGEELQLVSKFVPGRRVPLFEKEGLGEICTR